MGCATGPCSKDAAMIRFRLALGTMIGLLFAAASPAQPPAKPKEDPVAKAVAALYEGIRQETLPNGLRVYLKAIPGSPLVTVMTAYGVGSPDAAMERLEEQTSELQS